MITISKNDRMSIYTVKNTYTFTIILKFFFVCLQTQVIRNRKYVRVGTNNVKKIL